MAPARPLARPQLEHLTHQDERDDDGGRLEVAPHLPVVRPEGRREEAGHEDGGHTVEPRDAGAHADEREHVQAAGAEARPHAREEGPAPPDDDRRSQESSSHPRTAGDNKEWTRGPGSIAPMASARRGTVRARETRNRRVMSSSSVVLSSARVTVRGSSAMPQMRQGPGFVSSTSGSIGQTYSTSGPGGAAGRSGSGPRGRHRGDRGPRVQPVLGIGGKALPATRVAEPVGLGRVLVRAAPCRRGIDLHSADRVRLETNRARPPERDLRPAFADSSSAPPRPVYLHRSGSLP